MGVVLDLPGTGADQRTQSAGRSDRLLSVDPMTLEAIGEAPIRDREWVQRAVALARVAQRDWAAQGLRARLRVLGRAKRIILDEADAIADLVARECGKTHAGAIASELFPVVDTIAYYIKNAPRFLRRERIGLGHWTLMGRRSYLVSEPLGVVGVISPWNFPFFLSMGSVVMGLAAGNAVVLKPSEVTPLVGERIGEIFRRAGLPENLLVVASGEGETGRAVVESVDKLFFIGSERTARTILKSAAERLTPCVLELGGNAPALVLHDADLDNAARGIAWAAFFNAGQVCASVQRVYVDERRFDVFKEKLVAETKRLRVKPDRSDTDVGALTCDAQMRLVEQMVADAVGEGAQVLTGGRRVEGQPGLLFEPTVLTRVTQQSRFATDEVFGPVCMVMPFKDEDEALRLANDTRYGLTASVWTRDVRRGQRIAERIEAGSVSVNDHGITAGIAQTPWGGHKQSGFGVLHAREGLLEFVRRRHVHVNRLTGTPMPWWYPERRSLGEAMRNLTEAVAGDGLRRRLVSLCRALRGFIRR